MASRVQTECVLHTFLNLLFNPLNKIFAESATERIVSMASAGSTIGGGLCFGSPSMVGLKQSRRSSGRPRRMAVVVRAEGQTINPEIRKSEEKVVDSVVITELSKPLTAYCRLVIVYF
ncbi:hypothetical protein SLEP1_g60187 [Rubroshorea leprosula]|uniref:Uncharacterized protein n=1 Tax=Rubroshorea leprosula TaxID=152421 RepID=A0AAV5MUL1_9ROSI|nr:hypothetical protein SLEP1_g60187 [Rubroshorea leprosula]